MNLDKLCNFFEKLYKEQKVNYAETTETDTETVRVKKRKKYKPKKWARILIQSDGSIVYEGVYKKREFSVLVPNNIHDIDKQLNMIQEITWGHAHEFFVKYIVPNISKIRSKLHENGNVVIRFVSHHAKCKPVIYSEVPKEVFLEEIRG